jgi:hypothetical protein
MEKIVKLVSLEKDGTILDFILYDCETTGVAYRHVRTAITFERFAVGPVVVLSEMIGADAQALREKGWVDTDLPTFDSETLVCLTPSQY